MRRREFITIVGGVTASPFVVCTGAKADVPRVDVLSFGTVDSSGHLVDAFTAALNGLGYVEVKTSSSSAGMRKVNLIGFPPWPLSSSISRLT
jgi:hypothetical protein